MTTGRRLGVIPDTVEGERTAIEALLPRQRAFVMHYMQTKNAKESYALAGYSTKSEGSVGVCAIQLLKTAKVQAAIRHLEREAIKRAQREAGVNLGKVLGKLAALSFYDVRKLVNEDGSLKPLHELDEDTASAIEGIDVEEIYAGRGEERVAIGRVKKVRLVKRHPSLDSLMRHLNGYKAEKDGEAAANAAASANALVSLLEGMRRSAMPVAEEVIDQGDDDEEQGA